jgi:hypothetical protein
MAKTPLAAAEGIVAHELVTVQVRGATRGDWRDAFRVNICYNTAFRGTPRVAPELNIDDEFRNRSAVPTPAVDF